MSRYGPPVEAPSNQQHQKKQRVRYFLVLGFSAVGTIHDDRKFFEGPSKVNQAATKVRRPGLPKRVTA